MKRFLLLIICSFAYSTIINVPEDYSTIGEAIYHSIVADTVFISNGTYAEYLDLSDKSIPVTLAPTLLNEMLS